MKLKLNLTVLMVILFSISLLAQKGDDIIGRYKLPNELEIVIFKEGTTYSGKIVALDGYKDGITKDRKNPDKSKRTDDLLGMTIIKGLEYMPNEKKWMNGKLYGPEKGITINLKITALTDDSATAVGSKYFFWRTFEWKKM